MDLSLTFIELKDMISDELRKKLEKIQGLEGYTLLRPPFKKEDVEELFEMTQKN